MEVVLVNTNTAEAQLKLEVHQVILGLPQVVCLFRLLPIQV